MRKYPNLESLQINAEVRNCLNSIFVINDFYTTFADLQIKFTCIVFAQFLFYLPKIQNLSINRIYVDNNAFSEALVQYWSTGPDLQHVLSMQFDDHGAKLDNSQGNNVVIRYSMRGNNLIATLIDYKKDDILQCLHTIEKCGKCVRKLNFDGRNLEENDQVDDGLDDGGFFHMYISIAPNSRI
jgi:hypothetical protein